MAGIAPAYLCNGGITNANFDGRVEDIMEDQGTPELRSGDIRTVEVGRSEVNLSRNGTISHLTNVDVLKSVDVSTRREQGFNFFLAQVGILSGLYPHKNIDLRSFRAYARRADQVPRRSGHLP